MLTKAQSAAFDAYFHEADLQDVRFRSAYGAVRFDSTGGAGHDFSGPLRILKIIKRTTGSRAEHSDAVIRFVMENENCSLSDIHRATGLSKEQLSRILVSDDFRITMSRTGCTYAVKLATVAKRSE